MAEPPRTPPRLKPLSFRVDEVMNGQAETFFGEGIIKPEYHDGQLFWASALVMREGRPTGWRVTLDGVPIAALPFETSKPPGRPPEDARRIAVWLAWHIHFSREGKKGVADEKTGTRFGYAVADDDCKTVRDLRNKDIKDLIPALPSYEVGIKLETQEQPGSAAYIEKPTFYMKDGVFELLGMAWAWNESWGTSAAVYRAVRLTSKIENLDAEAWEKWKSKEGPMLFVIA